MRNNGSPAYRNKASLGFSLLELLIAVAVVTAVMAVVMRGIIQMQQRSSTESRTVDVSQQTRDFIDQMVRDIHNVGYPPPNSSLSLSPQVARRMLQRLAALILIARLKSLLSRTDGSRTVYGVYVQLQQGPGEVPLYSAARRHKKVGCARRYSANIFHRS